MEQLRLLLIEDEATTRDAIRIALEDAFGFGVKIDCVANRNEALKRNLGDFALILCDLHFSDGQGQEMTFLQDLQRRGNTPVILVTDENVGHLVVEAIRKGATDYVVKTNDFLETLPVVVQKNLIMANIRKENERLRCELEKALQDVVEKNGQLETSLKMVEELAATDPLTNLYNRRYFSRMLDQAFGEALRYGVPLSCIMIDLDKFKQLNDTLGHQKGDELVMLAAQCIQDNLRKVDIAARYGGDEFVVLLPHTPANHAVVVADRIRNQFKPASKLQLKLENMVTMSMGVAELHRASMNKPELLISVADKALYAAKGKGRDCVFAFDAVSTIIPAAKIPA